MAEVEAVGELRSSLAERRARADQSVAHAMEHPIRLPSRDEVLESQPVRMALAHPALAGAAVAALYLIGPGRLLRAATAAVGLVHTALSLRAAYRALREPGADAPEE